MTDNNNDEKRTLNPPDNINLPFFAYGIFKPGQLAYSKIKNHVDRESLTQIEINYEMRIRDGVPILIDRESIYQRTNGFIITFKKGSEKKAYGYISNTLLRELYEWKTIKINGKDVNLLFGLNPDKGSNTIEEPADRVNFDGKKDPLFNKAIKLIERNLNSNEFSWDEDNFFELQMNYMLLWSAIDRYSSLKYNKARQSWNNQRFANEESFKDGIKRYKDDDHQPVYSTDDLKIHEFDAENPYKTLGYYYTFRCNVVHRGKAMSNDYSMLKTATKELLEIFMDILENTFEEPYLRQSCEVENIHSKEF